jgi:hypothetical protein
MRSPALYDVLRRYCLGAFAALTAELDAGSELPFAFEEHGSYGRPTLYEYRPLVRGFVESRAARLAEREDARQALEELQREPAAAIFARAHAGPKPNVDRALYTTILVPLLVRTAEDCGGFDWDDRAFDRAYLELEEALFGEGHGYAAVAPLVGISVGEQVELGNGIRIRTAATGELSAHWPEASALLPARFGREPDRLAVLELVRSLGSDGEPPDAPAEVADVITALRLATAAPVAVGPVVFERLDWRPFGIRPALPIAATRPPGEPTRLDRFRGGVAAELLPRLGCVEDDHELAEALDRWELSLFQAEPFRSEQLRSALASATGCGDGAWAASLRASVLLADAPDERVALLAELRGSESEQAQDAVRRLLVELLLHGGRPALLAEVDEILLGLRGRRETVQARAS